MLQQHSFSTADYYDWLRSTDETCSTKRIVMLAVLIGSTTTYAKESWLVMALLATVTLVLATFSYVFSLIANWLVGLFIKKDAK